MNDNQPITTNYDPKPIPMRQFDWSALRYDDYEPGAPIGWGRTKAGAIADLIEKEENA